MMNGPGRKASAILLTCLYVCAVLTYAVPFTSRFSAERGCRQASAQLFAVAPGVLYHTSESGEDYLDLSDRREGQRHGGLFGKWIAGNVSAGLLSAELRQYVLSRHTVQILHEKLRTSLYPYHSFW